jgi:hypothetical protein
MLFNCDFMITLFILTKGHMLSNIIFGVFSHCPLDWMIIHVLHTQVQMNATWILDAGCYLQQTVCIPLRSCWIKKQGPTR